MRLVNNHKVEPPGGELLFHAVDLVDHGLVGRKRYPGVGASLECRVRDDRARIVRQMILEGVVRLFHKRRAIRKKEDIRHPVLTLKHID